VLRASKWTMGDFVNKIAADSVANVEAKAGTWPVARA
jgi:hypothetical protein